MEEEISEIIEHGGLIAVVIRVFLQFSSIGLNTALRRNNWRRGWDSRAGREDHASCRP